MKIGTKLYLGFGVLMAAIIVMVVLNLTTSNTLKNDVSDYSKKDLPLVIESNNIIDQINITARVIRNLILYSDPKVIADEMQRIQPARESSNKSFDIVSKLGKTPKEIELIQKLSEARKPFRKSLDSILEIVKQGKKEEAKALLFGDYR